MRRFFSDGRSSRMESKEGDAERSEGFKDRESKILMF